VYHHSRDVPATATKLLATLDRSNGKTIKANPRVITKGTSAELQITLRSTSVSGAPGVVRGIPMEPFSVNKDMGRILIRRGGETIAAGESTSSWEAIYLMPTGITAGIVLEIVG